MTLTVPTWSMHSEFRIQSGSYFARLSDNTFFLKLNEGRVNKSLAVCYAKMVGTYIQWVDI